MSAPVIVLGVTGSIAAYKAADLASLLVKGGAEVHVVMSQHACGYEGLGRLAAVAEIASRAFAKCGKAKPDRRTEKLRREKK